ncbi:MAG: hypothetical protein GXP08_18045 [Gammaproteobacteria bacterium]|nr:hypothetical protein [Gammaproteobacteria bacterium]
MSKRFLILFSHLPTVQKVIFTCALGVLGLGYGFASLYVFESHAGRDGKPMLTVQDLVIAYSGNKTGTVLESSLKGPMSNMLPATENLAIIDWVRRGADQQEYASKLAPIFEKRCVACHNNRNPHLPSLEDYEGVMHTAEQDTGMDTFTLVRVSHIHLFGLTFIFFIVSMIFSHAYMRREWLKIVIVIIPFVAIALDISSWFITKLYEPYAWMVIISGLFMGVSFALQALISLYQMWFYTLPDDVVTESVTNA